MTASKPSNANPAARASPQQVFSPFMRGTLTFFPCELVRWLLLLKLTDMLNIHALPSRNSIIRCDFIRGFQPGVSLMPIYTSPQALQVTGPVSINATICTSQCRWARQPQAAEVAATGERWRVGNKNVNASEHGFGINVKMYIYDMALSRSFRQIPLGSCMTHGCTECTSNSILRVNYIICIDINISS